MAKEKPITVRDENLNMVLEQACEMWTEMPKGSSTGNFGKGKRAKP